MEPINSVMTSSYAKPVAVTCTGLTLVALAALGARFVMRRFDFTSNQILLGAATSGALSGVVFLGGWIALERLGRGEPIAARAVYEQLVKCDIDELSSQPACNSVKALQELLAAMEGDIGRLPGEVASLKEATRSALSRAEEALKSVEECCSKFEKTILPTVIEWPKNLQEKAETEAKTFQVRREISAAPSCSPEEVLTKLEGILASTGCHEPFVLDEVVESDSPWKSEPDHSRVVSTIEDLERVRDKADLFERIIEYKTILHSSFWEGIQATIENGEYALQIANDPKELTKATEFVLEKEGEWMGHLHRRLWSIPALGARELKELLEGERFAEHSDRARKLISDFEALQEGYYSWAYRVDGWEEFFQDVEALSNTTLSDLSLVEHFENARTSLGTLF